MAYLVIPVREIFAINVIISIIVINVIKISGEAGYQLSYRTKPNMCGLLLL